MILHLAVVQHVGDVVVARRRSQVPRFARHPPGWGWFFVVQNAQVGVEAQAVRGRGWKPGQHGSGGLHQRKIAVKFHQVLAAVHQQVVPVMDEFSSANFTVAAMSAGVEGMSGPAATAVQRLNLSSLSMWLVSVRPGAHAHHAHAGASARASMVPAASSAALTGGVAPEIRFWVPELLVQQVDHQTPRMASPARPAQSARCAAPAPAARPRRCWCRCRSSAQSAEAGGVVVLEKRGAVDHGVHRPVASPPAAQRATANSSARSASKAAHPAPMRQAATVFDSVFG